MSGASGARSRCEGMMCFWETLRDRLTEDGRVFLALVADHSPHSPGTTGARLAVFSDGSTRGTIGGGIMEMTIVQRAVEVLHRGDEPFRLQKLVHRKDGDGEKSGLICAGSQTNLYLTLDLVHHRDVLDAVVDAERNDMPAVLEIDSTGRFALSHALATPIESQALELDGPSWCYRESIMNLSRVAILGGGHCGLALSQLMHRLGYHVGIYDTRPRVATMLENDYTDEKHIVEDFFDVGPRVRLPEYTSVVVMTTELSSDVRALLGVLTRPFPFVGVMGSGAKIRAIRKALADEVSSDMLAKLSAPVGLPIGSNTPDEIAVSVAAELLQDRSRRRAFRSRR